MIEKLKSGDTPEKKSITVVIDAGIATQDNLELLKSKGYDYICVARNKPVDYDEIKREDGLFIVKEDDNGNNKVEVKLIKQETESILYCKSLLKGEKEKSIKTFLQERIEKDLTNVQLSLKKKGGIKRYEKVLERIGRLKEKNSKIARYYTIEVKEKEGNVESIQWNFAHKEKADLDFAGSYFIRTSRMDLSEQEIWSIYTMLTNVEDSFRCLKSELALRPVCHQKQSRADGHLFITVLAYHLLISIQNIIKAKGIHMRWDKIREQLSTQVRVTTSMDIKDGQRLHIRNTSTPSSFNQTIFRALGIKDVQLKSIKAI